METENMDPETAEQYRYVHGIIDDEDITEDGRRQGYDLYGDDEERADAIKTSAWETIDHAIMSHVERGYDRVDAVVRVLPEVPKSMVDDVIDSERDMLPGLGDWNSFTQSLRLEQVAQRHHTRENFDNSETRREIWDELLKFGEYLVTVSGEVEYEDVFDEYRMKRKSSTDAHNDALRQTVRDTPTDRYNVEVTTKVMDRPFPDTDPLPDLEDFVFRY